MNPTANIIYKDLRRLWPYLLVYLAILALNISHYVLPPNRLIEQMLQSPHHEQLEIIYNILELMPYPAMWLLITLLIHQENLVGDRQYWLTRPLTGQRLLWAKSLFISIFILLPVFIGYLVVLKWHGFPLYGNISVLLMKMVVFTVDSIFLVMILASIFRSLVRMLLAIAIGIVLMAGIQFIFYYDSHHIVPLWGEFGWISASLNVSLLLIGTIPVLWIQFTQHRIKPARVSAAIALIAVTGAACFLHPGSWAFAIQKLLSKRTIDDSAVKILLDPSDTVDRSFPFRIDKPWLQLPIRIENVPPKVRIFGSACEFTMQFGKSERSHTGWRVMDDLEHNPWMDQVQLILPIDVAFFHRAKNSPVQISGFIDMTLWEIDAVRITSGIPIREYVSDIGMCYKKQYSLDCLSLWPIADTSYTPDFSSACAPWPTRADFTPVELRTLSWHGNGYSITRPIAHIRRYFEFKNLDLRDYSSSISVSERMDKASFRSVR